MVHSNRVQLSSEERRGFDRRPGFVNCPQTSYNNCSLCRKRELEGLIGEGAETVEPILDSFGGYSTDNLSNFYYPYIIVLLMIFRDEVSRHLHVYSLFIDQMPSS